MGALAAAWRHHPAHGRGIAQAELAEQLGLSQGQLSRLEAGRNKVISLDRLQHWARVLGIPAELLWFAVDHPPLGGADRLPDVRRSEFLQMSGLAVAGAALPAVSRPHTVTEHEAAEWLAWEVWQSGQPAHVADMPLQVARALGAVGQDGAPVTGPTMSASGQVVGDDGYYRFTQPSFVDFYVGRRIFGSLAAGKSRLLATAQTTYATDHVLRQFVARDERSVASLGRWMTHGANPVLRVNAAGVLAKLGRARAVEAAVAQLKVHRPTRHRYLTAVAHRVLGLDWQHAGQLATGAESAVALPAVHVRPLVQELTNPSDGAARWCAASLLAGSNSDHARTALLGALRSESCTETVRSMGAVLAGHPSIY